MCRWRPEKLLDAHRLSPFCYVSGGLEEAGVVVLLQALLRLCDEGAGALQTLATVGDLLRQLAQFHHLQTQKRRSGSHPKAVFSSVCSFVLISLSCKY